MAGVGIDITGNDKKLLEAFQRSQMSADEFVKKIVAAGTLIDTIFDKSGDSVDAQRQKIDALVKQYDSIRDILNGVDFSKGDVDISAYLEANKLLDEANVQLQQEKANIDAVVEAQTSANTVIEKQAQELQEVSTAATEVKTEVQGAGEAIKTVFEASTEKAEELKNKIAEQKKVISEVGAVQLDAYNEWQSKDFLFATGGTIYDEELDKQVAVTEEMVSAVKSEFDKLDAVYKGHLAELSLLESEYKGTLEAIAAKANTSASEISKSLDKGLGSDAIKVSTKELSEEADRLIQEFESINKAFQDSGKSVPDYTAYKNELSSLAGQMTAISSAIQNEVGDSKEMSDANEKLRGVLSSVNKEIRESMNVLEGATQKEKTLLAQRAQLKEALGRLERDGKRGTQEYKQLEEQLIEVGTAINVVNKNAKLLTTAGSAQLAGIIQGITGLSGAFSAGQGVMSLFVKDNEKLAAIQTKLQAAMAITIGLQQVSNTLHATSSFRINTVTKVTQLWNNAQKALNTSMGIGAGLSKAFMTGGVMLLVVAIGYLITKYKEWSKEQDRLNQLKQEELKIIRDANASIREQVTRVQALENILKDSNKSYKVRNNALNELKSIMPEYNAQLSKEGQLIADNTGALQKYIKEIKNAAFAKSATDKLVQSQNEYDEWLDNLSDADRKILELDPADFGNVRFRVAGDWEELAKKQNEYLTNIAKWQRKVEEYVSADVSKIEDHTKDYWEIQQKNAKAKLESMKDYEKGSKEWEQVVADYTNATLKLRQWDIKVNTDKQAESAAEKALKEAQKIADEKLKAENEEKRAALDSRNAKLENRQEELNLMEDSFAKEQAQLDLNHDKELLAIDKRTQELIEKEQERRRKIWDIANPNGTKKPYKTDVNSILDLGVADQGDIESSESIANQKQIKATADLLKSLLSKYQDYNAQRLEINKKYESDLAALETEALKNPTDDKDRAIAELKKQWSEALSSINLEEFQDQIDWSVVFSNLDKVSTDELVKLRDKLKQYLSSVGKSLSPQDLKTITDAFENLNEKIAEKKPINELTDGFKEFKKACEDVSQAQKTLNYLTEKGGKGSVAYKITEQNLTDAQNRRRESLVKMSQSLNKIGTVGSQMVNSGNELVDMLTNVGVKIPESVKGALSGIGQIMGGLEKIDLTKPASIISSTVSMISGLGNTIASIFGGGKHKSQEDAERLQEVTSRIEASNEAINKLIEKRISLIKESTAAESQYLNQLTQDQIKQQQQFIESQFNNVKGNWLFAKKGKNNNLTLEAVMRRYGLSDLADFVEWWGSGGYQELLSEGQGFVDKDMWDSIISSWEELGEAAKNAEIAMKEAATGTTFDALKDSLDDLVTQADLTFGDISDSFEDHMSQAILKMVKSRYLTKELEKWYDQFASAMDKDSGGGTDLTNAERQALEDYYKQIAETANNMYKQAMDLAGIDISDTVDASSKGIQSVTQDSFDEYLGTAYAQLQKMGDIRNINEASRVLLGGINNGVTDIQAIMRENNKVIQDGLKSWLGIERNTFRMAELLNKFDTTGVPIRN